MKLAAIFSVVVGVGMIAQWTMSYLTKQIPELRTEPIRIWFHITAEIITAFCLLISGVGILLSIPWSPNLYLVSMGMLFYTAIVSPGYFAQQGKWGWLGMFGTILVLGVISIICVF